MHGPSIVLLWVLFLPVSAAAAPAFTLVCRLHDEHTSREWTMQIDPSASTVDGRRAKIDGGAITWAGKENGFAFRHQINRRTGTITSRITNADGGPTTTFTGECLAGDKRTF
jgi:hypothetical protein